MYSFVLVAIAFLAEISFAVPVDFGLSSNFLSDNNNGFYQPCLASDLCSSLFPNGQPLNYLTSSGINENSLLTPGQADLSFDSPYASPRIINFAKENYVRDFENSLNTPVQFDIPYSPSPRTVNFAQENYVRDFENSLPTLVQADIPYNAPYASPRTVNFAKENYVRNFGYGSTEVGIRDQISVRLNRPRNVPPYSRVCSYFPFGTCDRRVKTYPLLSVDNAVAF